MPRVCTVCTHPERAAIDQALVNSESFRYVSKRFNLSTAALYRHKSEHLPATLAKAQEAAEIAQADTLLDQVRALQARALAILQKAEDSGDLKTALQAIGQARGNLELLARLLGELQEAQTVNNILITSPDWLHTRSAVLFALDPYPEARQAVVKALND